MTYYSNVQDVLDDSGIDPTDMGFEDTDLTAAEQLEAKIISWLTEAKSYIDTNRKRDFSLDLQNGDITAIPVCINSIAKRITLNIANSARLNRKSPTIKVNDYSIKPVTTNPMTPDILQDLETCSPLKEDPTTDTPFGCFTVNQRIFCKTQKEEDEDNDIDTESMDVEEVLEEEDNANFY